MQKLKIAASAVLKDKLQVDREVVKLSTADFTEVSAVVIDIEDYRKGGLNKVDGTALGIPVFLYLRDEENTPEELVGHVVGVISDNLTDRRLFGRQIDEAAKRYEDKVLPPFFGALAQYVYKGKSQFDCPGHQGGAYFRRHPAGRAFYDFYGEELFRSDLCNADVAMGDLLIHEGAPLKAQKAAAKIYNADKTYFVLNGTSASNKVVLNAALTPGDLVLYDRNNHKSVNHGALLQAGATPIYLETARNPFGFIGGIDEKCFDEKYLRDLIREKCPEKADAKRPFRLAVIQLGTYDGTIYNARQVVDKIGHASRPATGARLPCCSISARSCAAGSRSRRRRPDGQRHERAFAARFYARRAVAGQCRGRELRVPLRADRPGGARCGAQSESRAGDPPLPRRPLSGVVPLR